MSVSVNARPSGSLRRGKLATGGLSVCPGIALTISATTDYGATGILVSAFASKAGFSKIHAIEGISVRQSTGAIRELAGRFDVNEMSIRLYKGATVEITAASDLAANDIVSCTI